MKRRSSYTVTVTAYDGNNGGDRITVTINVTDAVGAAPSVANTASPRAAEDNRIAIKLPEPVQPGDVDTVSARQTRRSYANDLRHPRSVSCGRCDWGTNLPVSIRVGARQRIGMDVTISVKRLRQACISIRSKRGITWQPENC